MPPALSAYILTMVSPDWCVEAGGGVLPTVATPLSSHSLFCCRVTALSPTASTTTLPVSLSLWLHTHPCSHPMHTKPRYLASTHLSCRWCRAVANTLHTSPCAAGGTALRLAALAMPSLSCVCTATMLQPTAFEQLLPSCMASAPQHLAVSVVGGYGHDLQ